MLAFSLNYHTDMSRKFTESDFITAICTDQKIHLTVTEPVKELHLLSTRCEYYHTTEVPGWFDMISY